MEYHHQVFRQIYLTNTSFTQLSRNNQVIVSGKNIQRLSKAGDETEINSWTKIKDHT